MKKIFLILIPILILIAIVTCIFVMLPKQTSSVPENSEVKVGELDNANMLEDNIESSNNAVIENNEKENSTSEVKSENKESNTNTLTNTTSNSKTNTEEKSKTTTNTQNSVKTNNTSKSNNTNTNKTGATNSTTSKKPTTNTSNSSTNKTTTSNKTNTNSTTTKPTTTKTEEKHTHFMTVNAGWFNSVDELEKAVDIEFEKWDKKYKNGEITWDELGIYCPIGYETFRCSCGKYGLNYSYE